MGENHDILTEGRWPDGNCPHQVRVLRGPDTALSSGAGSKQPRSESPRRPTKVTMREFSRDRRHIMNLEISKNRESARLIEYADGYSQLTWRICQSCVHAQSDHGRLRGGESQTYVLPSRPVLSYGEMGRAYAPKRPIDQPGLGPVVRVLSGAEYWAGHGRRQEPVDRSVRHRLGAEMRRFDIFQ